MMPDDRLQRGMYVRFRLIGDGDWCPAFVALASPDVERSSVLLLFDGAIRTPNGGVITHALPLTVDYANQIVTGLLGGEYEIEVRETDNGV